MARPHENESNVAGSSVAAPEVPTDESGDTSARAATLPSSKLSPEQAKQVAVLRRKLAQLYESMGMAARAIPLLELVLASDKRLYKANDLEVVSDLSHLGSLQYKAGRYNMAAQTLARALTLGEQSYGPNHLELAPVLADLGNTYNELERYAEAEPLLKRCLAIRQMASRPDDMQIAVALNNLADLKIGQHQLNEAERLLRLALEKVNNADDADESVSCAILNNYGTIYDIRGNYKKAQEMYRQAIKARLIEPMSSDYGLSRANCNLAQSLLLTGEFDEALSLSSKACEIDSETIGGNHPYVAHDLVCLGDAYAATGQYLKAQDSYKSALDVLLKEFADTHSEVIKCKSRYAMAVRKVKVLSKKSAVNEHNLRQAGYTPYFR